MTKDEQNIDDLALAGDPVTPEGSVLPVYDDDTPIEPPDEPVLEPIVDPELRASAVAKLMAGEPLTEAEAQLVTGGGLWTS